MIISVSLIRHLKFRRQTSYLIGDRDRAAAHSGVLNAVHHEGAMTVWLDFHPLKSCLE